MDKTLTQRTQQTWMSIIYLLLIIFIHDIKFINQNVTNIIIDNVLLLSLNVFILELTIANIMYISPADSPMHGRCEGTRVFIVDRRAEAISSQHKGSCWIDHRFCIVAYLFDALALDRSIEVQSPKLKLVVADCTFYKVQESVNYLPLISIRKWFDDHPSIAAGVPPRPLLNWLT